MKIHVKHNGRRHSIEVDDAATVADLKAILKSMLDLNEFALSLNQRDYFDDDENLSKTLKEQGIVASDTIYVIAETKQDPNCSFLKLPVVPLKRICDYLSVTDFCRFSVTCKKMRQLWDDDQQWKHFLERDFGKIASTEAARGASVTKFKDAYESRYVQKMEEKKSQNTGTPNLPNPNPPPGVIDPQQHNPPPPNPAGPAGMIGGPHDLNPYGHFPAPVNPYHPRPGYPQPHPGHPDPQPDPFNPFPPRIRQRLPYDPDAGLFGQPQPGRGTGRGRGGDPFGGGPHFPGGGFF